MVGICCRGLGKRSVVLGDGLGVLGASAVLSGIFVVPADPFSHPYLN